MWSRYISGADACNADNRRLHSNMENLHAVWRLSAIIMQTSQTEKIPDRFEIMYVNNPQPFFARASEGEICNPQYL